MVTVPGLDNINFLGIFAQTIYWIGWSLLGLLVVGGFGIFAYWFSFPIKITYWELYGTGKEGTFSVGRQKTNRARKGKGGNSWILMKPIIKSKEIEPFDSEYIYAGKNCYGFDLNGTLFPGRINVNVSNPKDMRAEVSPVPFYVRHWQALERKKNAMEYAMHDWWTDNKSLVIAMLVGFGCLATCIATVWLTYKFATPGLAKMDSLTRAINNFATIK